MSIDFLTYYLSYASHNADPWTVTDSCYYAESCFLLAIFSLPRQMLFALDLTRKYYILEFNWFPAIVLFTLFYCSLWLTFTPKAGIAWNSSITFLCVSAFLFFHLHHPTKIAHYFSLNDSEHHSLFHSKSHIISYCSSYQFIKLQLTSLYDC